MSDLTVVFRSASDIEARVVRGLLESHGIESLVSQGSPRSIFPVQVDSIAEIRIAVRPEDADEARRLIDSHRIDPADGRVIPLRNEFAALERRIGYTFRDPGLLEHALTHTSRANEDVSGGVIDNESLEFLGDAVLGFVVADMLFTRFPRHSEGYKSKVKAGIVSAASLARLAEEIDLGRFVLLGRGEEKTGGRHKHAILADSFEALIASIYLDGGIEAASVFIVSRLGPLIAGAGDQAAEASFTDDWKSALQEFLQASGRGLPVYRVASAEGPDHRKRFAVELVVGGDVVARGEGKSKKEAEQLAARQALSHLRDDAPA